MPGAPELDRLVSALRAAQTAGLDADAGTVRDCLCALESAWAECPPDLLDTFDQANIQLARSSLRAQLDLDAAECTREALRLGRQLGPEAEDQRLLVQILLESGDRARQAGDFATARPLIDEAVQRARTVLGPHAEETAQAYNCLGLWGRYRGEFELARQSYTSALKIIELAPHPWMRADVLHNLASLEHLCGQLDLALELIETGLRLRHDHAAGRERDEAVRAVILMDLGRYDESAALVVLLSDRLSRRWGPDSADMMHLLANWAVLEQRRGDFEAAARRYAQALDLADRLGETAGPAAAGIYANAAHLALTQGERDRAGEYARQALSRLEGWAAAELPTLHLAQQVRDAVG